MDKIKTIIPQYTVQSNYQENFLSEQFYVLYEGLMVVKNGGKTKI